MSQLKTEINNKCDNIKICKKNIYIKDSIEIKKPDIEPPSNGKLKTEINKITNLLKVIKREEKLPITIPEKPIIKEEIKLPITIPEKPIIEEQVNNFSDDSKKKKLKSEINKITNVLRTIKKVKPAEVVPAEVKPAEVVPAEVKPAEVVPVEVKPAEVVPAEVVPAEVVPAEVKPAEVVPAEVVPAEVKPAEVIPAEIVPAEVVPAEVVPAEVVPAVTDKKKLKNEIIKIQNVIKATKNKSQLNIQPEKNLSLEETSSENITVRTPEMLTETPIQFPTNNIEPSENNGNVEGDKKSKKLDKEIKKIVNILKTTKKIEIKPDVIEPIILEKPKKIPVTKVIFTDDDNDSDKFKMENKDTEKIKFVPVQRKSNKIITVRTGNKNNLDPEIIPLEINKTILNPDYPVIKQSIKIEEKKIDKEIESLTNTLKSLKKEKSQKMDFGSLTSQKPLDSTNKNGLIVPIEDILYNKKFQDLINKN